MKLIDPGPSSHSLHPVSLAAQCLQLYAFTYEAPADVRRAATRLQTGVGRTRGILGHQGLAHLYARLRCVQQGRDPDDPNEGYHPPAVAMDLRAAVLGKTALEEVGDVKGAVARYAEVYADDARRYDVLHVEEVIGFTLKVGGWSRECTQRVDRVIRERATGKVFVLDSKFHHTPSRKELDGYAPTIQFLAFRHWGPGLFGSNWGGAIVDMVGSVPPYSMRRELVQPAPGLVRRLPLAVKDIEDQIARLKAEKRPYGEWPPAANEVTCMTRYGKCPMWESCLWG